MIITDQKTVKNILDELLNKEGYITVDRKDILNLFGENPELRMIQVAADSVDNLLSTLKQDFESIGGVPNKYFAAYVSMYLKMSDLQRLDEITGTAAQIKRTAIFEKSPLGSVVLYFFFE